MTLSVRRALAAAAATTTLLALAGCGGDDSANEKASDQAATSSPTSDASPDASDGSDAAGEGEALTGAEFADVLKSALDKATTAHVTMELGGGLGTAEGDADYTQTPPELTMSMTMDALGGDVEARVVDGTMYLKSATFGDKWVSISLDDPNSPLAAIAGQLDIKKDLERFADAVTSATHNGQEDVDGESLDHYTAVVDSKKLLADLPSAAAGQADLPATLTQEWWFDGDGLVRKFSSDFGGGATVMTMSDWGADVEIEAPPSDEVTTMPGAVG